MLEPCLHLVTLVAISTPPLRVRLHGDYASPAEQARSRTCARARRSFAARPSAGDGASSRDWLVCQYAPCAASLRILSQPGARPRRRSARSTKASSSASSSTHADSAAATPRQSRRALAGESHRTPRGGIAEGVTSSATRAVAPRTLPVRLKRIRLGDRVGSLFIADYLNRAERLPLGDDVPRSAARSRSPPIWSTPLGARPRPRR